MKQYLVLSGGGIKGLVFLTHLKKYNLNQFHSFSGSSIGALICTGILLQYTLDEMIQWLLHVDYEKICPNIIKEKQNKNILASLYNYYALDNASYYFSLLQDFLEKKHALHLTFHELYKKTKKELYITGSNIQKYESVYFSYKTHPHMTLFDALKITTAIPFIFPPILYKETYHVDGHLFEPIPWKCFSHVPSKHILCLVIISKKSTNTIHNAYDYTMSLLKSFYHKYLESQCKKHVVMIPVDLPILYLNPTKQELDYLLSIDIPSHHSIDSPSQTS